MTKYTAKLIAVLLVYLIAAPAFGIDRNVSSQTLELQAIDRATGGPKTGDAANITAYVSIDGDTTPDTLTDTSATEVDSTKAPGVYRFDLTQAETNGKSIVYSAKSSTSGIDVIARLCWTVPSAFSTAPLATQSSLDTVDDFLDTEIAAIKTKTDFLPSATAGASGGVFIAGTNAATTVTTSFTTTFTGNLTGSVGSVTGLTASDVGAIKTKTDFLPSATAGAAGGLMIAGTNAQVTITSGFGANSITATSLATDTITAAKIAASSIGSSELASNAIAASHIAKTAAVKIGDNVPDVKAAGSITVVNTQLDFDVSFSITPEAAGVEAGDTIIFDDGSGNLARRTIVTVNVSGTNLTIDDDYAGSAGHTFRILSAASGGSAPSAATVADAVWDEARAGHTTSGTFGQGVASVQGSVTGSVATATAVTAISSGGISSASFAAGSINAAAIATDAIGDAELASDVAVALTSSERNSTADALINRAIGSPSSGTAGKAWQDAGSAGNPWSALLTDNNTALTFGHLVQTYLDAQVSEISGFSSTERAQVLAALSIGEETGVPKAQTWVVKRIDGQLKATATIPKDSEETFDVLADFRGVLASGDAIKPADEGGIVSIELIDDGNEGDQVESDAFDDVDNATIWMNAGIRFTVSGGTIGQTDRIRVKALTVDGKTLSVPCSIKVTDAGAP